MRGEQLIYALAGGNYTFNLDVDKVLYPGAVNYWLTKNQATLWSGVAGSTGLYSYSLLADATASTYNLTVKYAKLTLPKSYKRNLGDKQYELTDHLGNVRAVVSAKVNYNSSNNIKYTPTIITTTSYYPFGMAISSLSSNSDKYRYGFNGKEKDDKGEWGMTNYDYGFRIYNPAIAKFLSVDPLTKSYPELTPYQFASNTPIECIDLDGLEKMTYLFYTGKNGKTEMHLASVKYLDSEGNKIPLQLIARWGTSEALSDPYSFEEGLKEPGNLFQRMLNGNWDAGYDMANTSSKTAAESATGGVLTGALGIGLSLSAAEVGGLAGLPFAYDEMMSNLYKLNDIIVGSYVAGTEYKGVFENTTLSTSKYLTGSEVPGFYIYNSAKVLTGGQDVFEGLMSIPKTNALFYDVSKVIDGTNDILEGEKELIKKE
ncbi:MAG: hypothetical protein KBG80_05980 [Breznakibacter sp.]|nr:hypothetical protein [Breznakibacter sp.]